MKKELSPLLSKLYNRLESLYGSRLNRMILFGSQARADAQPGSDIDVMIVLEGSVNPYKEIDRTSEIVAGLSLEYDEVISGVFVSTEQFKDQKTPLLLNVHREGIVWPVEKKVQESHNFYNATTTQTNGSYIQQKNYPPQREENMTPAQSALLQKASESLQAAKLLASQNFFDFAASRAYYTMFYVASAFLLGESLSFSKHSTVIAKFGQHFAKTGRVPAEFHRYLINAQNSRIIGDYHLGSNLDKTETQKQIAHAEQFLELAERLIGSISSPESE